MTRKERLKEICERSTKKNDLTMRALAGDAEAIAQIERWAKENDVQRDYLNKNTKEGDQSE